MSPLILAILQAAMALLPEIESLVPIVQKLVAGDTLTSQDNATAWAAIVQLEQMASAKETAALAPSAPAA